MRIPGWLVAIVSMGAFAFLTALCSFITYGFVRTAVIDAADQGVEVPSVAELVQYVINPRDASDVFGGRLDIDESVAPTSAPAFVLQPTATPDPDAIATAEATPTGDAPPVEPTATPSNQIALADFLAGGASTEAESESGEPEADEPEQVVDDPAALAELPAWQSFDRVNILLMGTDERGDEQFEDRFRTDTMIVVQIDPVTQHIGVLSFPRDLWVRIPSFQPNKIAFANYLGDGADLPGGGPALAKETIYVNFGIRVDYFVQINFDVFETVVDTIAPEGVEICIPEGIRDTNYPDAGRGTITIEFEAGCQRLNSERLLQYARTRATQGGDFDRNRRQQEVLDAVQKQLLSVGGLASLIQRIPAVYTELAGSYRTDFSVEELMALARLITQIPNENITYGQINALHVTPGVVDGLDILIPNAIAINNVISETFDPQPNLSIGDLRARAEQENATIAVLNNTEITGLATRTQEWLTSRGVRVDSVGNVPEINNPETTIILDFTGNTFTTRLIAEVMGLPRTAIRVGAGGNIAANTDIAIVVGIDADAIISGD